MPNKIVYKISDIGDVVGGGTPSTKIPEYWNGDISWISPSDLTNYNDVYISYGSKNITQLGFNKSGAKFLPRNSVLLSSRAPIGYIALADKELCTNQGFKSIVCNSKINYMYLYYYIKYNVDHFKAFASGATFPELSTKRLKNIKIEIFENVEYQEKIGKMIFRYDELIKNNRKQIEILENIAKKMYSKMFAYHVIKDKSEEVKIKDILSFNRGISYSSDEIDCQDGCNLINLKNINSYGGFRRDGTKKYNGKYKETQIVKTWDLVMGVTDMTQDRRTVGSVALIPTLNGVSVISADLVRIDSKINNTYLFSMFKYGELSKYISQFANGANVLHLKPQSIANVKIQLPFEELIEQYVAIVEPIIKEIDALYLGIDNLITQRDLIAPRLLSGKLVIE